MAQFEATVRLFDLAESDAAAARRVVDERLRSAGFSRWQIVSLGSAGTTFHAMRARRRDVGAPSRRRFRADVGYAGGSLLVAAIAAWALWFLWLLAG